MSSCTTSALTAAPRQWSPAAPTSALVALVARVLRRPVAAFAALATAALGLATLTLVLRGSPVWLVRDADASLWHPGDGFDLSAGRALVEGLEVAAAALGLVGKLRLATVTAGLLGLALCFLHA
jgi:hypothetical protein